MRRKKTVTNTYECKRYECLYHAPKFALNGCDYCVITGHLRQCKPGDMCDKHTYSTPEQRKELSMKRLLYGDEYI